MDSKKYRLLKDLPDAAAGTILTFDGKEDYDYQTHDGITGWYKKTYIENNPEWFEEVIPFNIVSFYSYYQERGGGDYRLLTSVALSRQEFMELKKVIETFIETLYE